MRISASALAASLAAWTIPASAQHIIVGIDNKVYWDETGKMVTSPADKDAVFVLDIADRLNPKMVGTLPLVNSVFGPPTNLAITPDGGLALVANSMDWVLDAGAWKGVPGSDIYGIDPEASPPKLVTTIKGGKQPSGMAINRAGNLALVANRADSSITVLSIKGQEVKVVDSVPMGEQVSAVAFLPDGKRVVAAKNVNNKAAMLAVDGEKVTYTKYDMLDGKKVSKIGEVEVRGLPEGAAFSPDGKYLYVGNYMDDDVLILEVDGTSVTDTGKRVKLPGHPASMRGTNP